MADESVRDHEAEMEDMQRKYNARIEDLERRHGRERTGWEGVGIGMGLVCVQGDGIWPL